MYSYVALEVAAAVPVASSVSRTGPEPGLAAEVTPYEAVRQVTSDAVTLCTAHGSPTIVTAASDAPMPEGSPATVSVIRVPPAVEPRRGEMPVTVGVSAA